MANDYTSTIAAVSTLMIAVTIALIAVVDRVVGIGRVAGP